MWEGDRLTIDNKVHENCLTPESIKYINTQNVHEVQKLIEKLEIEIGFYYSFRKSADSMLPVDKQIGELDKLKKDCLKLKNDLDNIHKAVVVNSFSDLQRLKQMSIDFSELRKSLGKDLESMSIALGVIRENMTPHKGKVGRKTNLREEAFLTDVSDLVFEFMIEPKIGEATKIAIQILMKNHINVLQNQKKASEAIRAIKKRRSTPK